MLMCKNCRFCNKDSSGNVNINIVEKSTIGMQFGKMLSCFPKIYSGPTELLCLDCHHTYAKS